MSPPCVRPARCAARSSATRPRSRAPRWSARNNRYRTQKRRLFTRWLALRAAVVRDVQRVRERRLAPRGRARKRGT
jgi:hypothetical protein